MKILKIICIDSIKCHKSMVPSPRGLLHIPNNHIATYEADYTSKGELKDPSIHSLARTLMRDHS